MYVLALTGGLGSGKSTAAEVFADRGAVVIDLDDVAKTLLDEAPAVRDRVIEEFGPEVRRDDGTEVTVIGYPARLVGATPASYRQAPPRFAQDTLEVLKELWDWTRTSWRDWWRAACWGPPHDHEQ